MTESEIHSLQPGDHIIYDNAHNDPMRGVILYVLPGQVHADFSEEPYGNRHATLDTSSYGYTCLRRDYSREVNPFDLELI